MDVLYKTGIHKPSRGDIYILGRDYNRQKDSSKYLIGYCPQDNILVNDLTAIQHVYLFGMILVLDEPGYGVDPQNRRRVWDTLLVGANVL
nr:ABC transporter A family member 8-like [Neodiprion pinetum]